MKFEYYKSGYINIKRFSLFFLQKEEETFKSLNIDDYHNELTCDASHSDA